MALDMSVYGVPKDQIKVVKGDGQSQLQNLGDFLKLFTAQMTNQDPLQPADGAQFFSQTAQITMVEQLLQMNQKDDTAQKTLEAVDRTLTSAYLGTHVTANVTDAKGATKTVTGVVTDISYDDKGTPSLGLDTGDTVQISNITKVASHY